MPSILEIKKENKTSSTSADVVIIGAGAAGLMAACTAGENHLRCLVLEKKHRPGLKLLMCGNNRCNISHYGKTNELLDAYGSHSGGFLEYAIRKFSPVDLREWFERGGLPTIQLRDRIYPKSERADDVLHFFTDKIRDLEIPIAYNCPVKKIEKKDDYFFIQCENFSVTAKNVLIATGGVSYPKTGSTGDGALFATELGLKTIPFRAGLSAITSTNPALNNSLETECNQVSIQITILTDQRKYGPLKGNLLLENNILRGTAVFDTSRLLGRLQPTHASISIDMFPDTDIKILKSKLETIYAKIKNIHGCINALGIEHGFCNALSDYIQTDMQKGKYLEAAQKLKNIVIDNPQIHPEKECICAIGGIDINEINPETMEAWQIPGLYFAGETIDAEGPTGGYNLHAAFSTARLAIAAITEKFSKYASPSPKYSKNQSQINCKDKKAYHFSDKNKKALQNKNEEKPLSNKAVRYGTTDRQYDKNKKKSAWGKNFWK